MTGGEEDSAGAQAAGGAGGWSHPGDAGAGGQAAGQYHRFPHEDASGEHAALIDSDRFELADQDRLPWLEGDDEDEEEGAIETGRVVAALAGMLALLAVIVGGIWWFTHHRDASQALADGSTVTAPPGPYKEAPKNPGGKTYDGTGDSSYVVSQGKSRPGQLADGGGTQMPEDKPAASPAAGAAGAAPVAKGDAGKAPAAKSTPKSAAKSEEAAWSGGVAQVGAYSSQSLAEAAWGRLAQQHDALSGVHHRIVVGQADIGTVYRLQVLTAPGAAGTLCENLRGQGLSCQVKH